MQKIKYLFKDNYTEFITHFLASFGTIWLFLEFLSAIFPKVKSWIELNNWSILLFTLLISLIFGLVKAWPVNEMTKKFKASNTEICVKIGDLFSQSNNVVVTSSDYFDTTIPQGTRVSLKSQMIDKFFSGNIQTLDNLIDKSLRDQGKTGVYNDTKNGKQYSFPIGTIAVIPTSQNKLFISILATLTFTNNTKHTSSDPYKLNTALNELWKQIRIEGRMKEVSVPILGSGLSGINLSNLMIIESIILSYATHSKSSRISDKLTIIIPRNKYDPKDFYEICRFLQSIQI